MIEFFEEIFNIKDVYCFISVNDGLFDVKEYDVIEIDIVSIVWVFGKCYYIFVFLKKIIF